MSSSAERSTSEELLWILLCTLALAAVVIFSKFAVRRCREAEQQALAVVDRPLLPANRVDAAVRAAAAGAIECPSCGFENYASHRACIQCAFVLENPSERFDLSIHVVDMLHRCRWRLRIVNNVPMWIRVGLADSAIGSFLVQLRKDDDPASIARESSSSVTCHFTRVTGNVRICAVVELPSDWSYQVASQAAVVEKAFPVRYAYFVQACAKRVRAEPSNQVLKLAIHRAFAVEESLHHVGCLRPEHLDTNIHVTFLDEKGVDAGGLHREWLHMVAEAVIHPAIGLFVCSNAATSVYYLKPPMKSAAEAQQSEQIFQCYGVGRIVGRCLVEGGVWSFHFARPLLKLLVGQPLDLDDLAAYDSQLYENLMWLLRNDHVESLGLSFAVVEQQSDVPSGVVEVELLPRGNEVDVTDANKYEYIERQLQYVLVERVSEQLHAFVAGVYEVVPYELLAMLSPEELDFMLCGVDEIDVREWEAHTHASRAIRSSKLWRWFFDAVRSMTSPDRRRLLQFATGSDRLPVGGFASLTSHDGRVCAFTLEAIPYVPEMPYIRAHTCFNRLDVPLYPSRKELEKMLQVCVKCDVTGFTIL